MSYTIFDYRGAQPSAALRWAIDPLFQPLGLDQEGHRIVHQLLESEPRLVGRQGGAARVNGQDSPSCGSRLRRNPSRLSPVASDPLIQICASYTLVLGQMPRRDLSPSP
jgi:hypothetical protein